MRNSLKKILFVFVCILAVSNFVYSAVEVFSDYDTTLTVNNDNTIDVNKTLTIKNVYDVGIVPGQIEFKIAKGIDGSISNLEIIGVSANDMFGKSINTQVRSTEQFSVIILDIYYPLLPGFEYTFDLNYKLSYSPGGIFFKSLQIPLRESTIPIQSGEFKIILPDNYHFTYLGTGDEDLEVYVDGNEAMWDIKDNLPKSIVFEYSYLPISIGNFKGSYIFWITINVILLVFLFFEVRKEIRKVRDKYGG